MRTLASLILAATLALTLGACKQGVGDICQVDSDCQSGLVCSKVAGQTVQHCKESGGQATVDSAVAADSAPAPDAEALDAAPLDAAPPDAQ